MSTLTPHRLEVVRLTREHCTVVAELQGPAPDRLGATMLLNTPIKLAASWVQPSESVMANIRLLVHMAVQTRMEAMIDRAPEQTSLCTTDECPGASRCSSGATVWHARTGQCTEIDRAPEAVAADW